MALVSRPNSEDTEDFVRLLRTVLSPSRITAESWDSVLDVVTVSGELAKDERDLLLRAALSISGTEERCATLVGLVQELWTREPLGYEEIKTCLREITPLRTAVEKRRKELKKDALEWGRKVDSEAKRITQALVDIEAPHREAKKAIDEEAARLEEEARAVEEQRIESIQLRINEMGLGMTGHGGMSVDTIDSMLQILDTCYEEFDFQEFAGAAEVERDRVRNHLLAAMTERKRYDEEQANMEAEKARMAAEREALDKEKAEQQAEIDRKQAELNAQAEAQRKQQDEIELKRREEEAKKLAAEREEARKVQQEKERLEREAIEAAEAAAREKAAVAEAKRQDELRPDVEKLQAWAEEIRYMEGPAIKDPACEKLRQQALRGLGEVGNDLHKGIKAL